MPSSTVSMDDLRTAVADQGAVVRKLKESNPSPDELASAVEELKIRKVALATAEKAAKDGAPKVDRAKFENLMKRRFFYGAAFSVYGGVAGLYDLGPAGCALKANMVNYWRNHFVVEENMLEVECTMLTPEYVLKASGHVDRFTDFMVKDVKTGECYRADHLLEAHLEKAIEAKGCSVEKKGEMEAVLRQIDNYGLDEIGGFIRKYECKAPATGNDLSDPAEFNLMFGTQIGPTGLLRGFMRPETAQGIFVNFKRLLEYNQDKVPFAGAQIGQSFIHPDLGCYEFENSARLKLSTSLIPKTSPTRSLSWSRTSPSPCIPEKHNCQGGVINSETMGYFLARIQQYLTSVGIPADKLRFRQHMGNEMAHYACDCWDAECLTTYGWVEIVGCADRSCFDLNAHAKAASTKFVAQQRLAEPVSREVTEVTLNKAVLGKAFKKEAGKVSAAIAELSDGQKEEMKAQLESGSYQLTVGDTSYEITPAMISGVKTVTKTEHVREFVPSVIEPSFGIGRILYCILECNFKVIIMIMKMDT
eukprot:sb/3463769/